MTKAALKRGNEIESEIEALEVDREKIKMGLRVITEAVDLRKFVDIPALKTKIQAKIKTQIDTLKAEFTAL